MSHVSTSHVAHMNVSFRTYECVISHVWMRHIRTCGCVIFPHINASCRSDDCVMLHICTNDVAYKIRMNESCRNYEGGSCAAGNHKESKRIHVPLHADTDTCTHTYTQIHTHTHTHTRTEIHIQIHIHIGQVPGKRVYTAYC